MAHHDEETPRGESTRPANRLNLDYGRPLAPKLPELPILDVHTHVRVASTTALLFEAAELYGVRRIVSMTPLDELDLLRRLYPGRLEFIAVPRWRDFQATEDFRALWLDDLAVFRERGARVMKFWSAPPMRAEHGVTLEHPFMQPVIQRGVELGFDFMVHVGDPSVWWEPGERYADTARFGAKREQYRQLEFILREVAPRFVIAAHMGGFIEEPDFLQELLDRHKNLYLDSSATKWIVREVARQPERVRTFLLDNAERVLFGSDLVVANAYDFEHYASRYWAHRRLWESDYRGESPIDDPDAGQPPLLAGLDLPAEVLRRLYWDNARRLGFGGE